MIRTSEPENDNRFRFHRYYIIYRKICQGVWNLGSGRPGCFYHASGDVIQSFWSSFFQKACGSRAEPSSLSAESETPPAFQKRGKRGLGGRNPEGGCVPHSPIFCTAECKTQIQTHIFNSLIHPLPEKRPSANKSRRAFLYTKKRRPDESGQRKPVSQTASLKISCQSSLTSFAMNCRSSVVSSIVRLPSPLQSAFSFPC